MKCASLSLSFVSSFFVAVSKARAASRRFCCCACRLFGEDGIVNCGTARKALELVCQDCRRARVASNSQKHFVPLIASLISGTARTARGIKKPQRKRAQPSEKVAM
jgi:hypothetical protein